MVIYFNDDDLNENFVTEVSVSVLVPLQRTKYG